MAEKVIYFDCASGVSSDMLLGALVDVGADTEHMKREVGKLISAGFNITAAHIKRHGIGGADMNVIVYDTPLHDHDYYETGEEPADGSSDESGREDGNKDRRERTPVSDHDHDFSLPGGAHQEHGYEHDGLHNSYHAIRHLVSDSGLSTCVKQRMLDIYGIIAEAEAAVHETSKDEVVFHEVGRLEQIITIAAICVAVEELGVTKFLTSAVHDGSGQIECAHGFIPVPVPAVVEMLKKSSIPVVIEADVTTEMVTPSGLGILEGLGAKYEKQFAILPERTGYGFGKRETGRFGAVRVILGAETSI